MTIDPEERRASYQRSFAAHGESPRALKWKGYPAAAQRFRQLVADINPTGKTILDVGCGMGDLLPFLYAKGSGFRYQGLDITPEFIAIARKRYEGHQFAVADALHQPLTETYDVVLCSGALNASVPGWQQDRPQLIERLFSYANQALVFNMAGTLEPAHESGNIGYADAREILNFCIALTPKVIFRNHYNRRDFTIALFK